MQIRQADDRGYFDHGWLQTRHTFSFGNYVDPEHMGFRSLCVINEDHIKPGTGFGTHPHHDMEIITWMISGALEHSDSMGNTQALHAGQVQRMTAGSGITHSEKVPDSNEHTHLLQIWIHPERKGLTPSYEDVTVDEAFVRNRWGVIAAPSGGLTTIQQDAVMSAARMSVGTSLPVSIAPIRFGWLQVVQGELTLAGQHLGSGDGCSMAGPFTEQLVAQAESEVLFFDLS
jgi:quercetin 2,3-dioxygenase